MRKDIDKSKIEKLMAALGRTTTGPGRVYFTGGASAVLLGWRSMTIDVDIKFDPEPERVFDALPMLKNELDINIELSAPDDFIPVESGWRERSRFIARYGQVDYFHFDFYSQALSKIERFHARDEVDIHEMMVRGLVEKRTLRQLFLAIEPELKRYPAIEPAAFRERVDRLTQKE